MKTINDLSDIVCKETALLNSKGMKLCELGDIIEFPKFDEMKIIARPVTNSHNYIWSRNYKKW